MQLHVYLLIVFSHVAPFTQGLLTHSSISAKGHTECTSHIANTNTHRERNYEINALKMRHALTSNITWTGILGKRSIQTITITFSGYYKLLMGSTIEISEGMLG